MSERRYASIAVAAEKLQVTPQAIRNMIKEGRLTGYRNGSRLVRIDLNEIDALMEPYGGAAADPAKKRDIAADRLAQYVKTVVAQAPPLTNEQREQISALLVRGGAA